MAPELHLCLTCRELAAEHRGGLPRATRDLATALAQQGHHVRLLTDGDAERVPQLEGVTVKALALPPGPFASAPPESAAHNLMYAAAVYREVSRIHEHEQPVDLVLAPLWRSEGAVCLLDPRFPTVVSCMTSLQTLSELDPAYRALADIDERLALEHHALSQSPYLHGLTRAVLNKTISDNEPSPAVVAVINRGLRDRRGEPGGGDREQRAPHVLFVGRIERRKGVDVLLAAAGELLSSGEPLTFTLAGLEADPEFRSELERQFDRMPLLRAAVRLTGTVADAELDQLYRDADIVCLPSRYESHGVALLEAMMFGKAILTCDGGGVSEVVRDGRDALVVEPGDASALATALRWLAGDQALREELGERARSSFERRYEAAAIATQMTGFFEQVIHTHHRRSPAHASVPDRLAGLIGAVFSLPADDASAYAWELLQPPAAPRAPTAPSAPVPASPSPEPAPRPRFMGPRPPAEPAPLTAREPAESSELEELRERLREAERRAAQSERQLAAVLRSRSWQLTSPLRELGVVLRERARRR